MVYKWLTLLLLLPPCLGPILQRGLRGGIPIVVLPTDVFRPRGLSLLHPPRKTVDSFPGGSTPSAGLRGDGQRMGSWLEITGGDSFCGDWVDEVISEERSRLWKGKEASP